MHQSVQLICQETFRFPPGNQNSSRSFFWPKFCLLKNWGVITTDQPCLTAINQYSITRGCGVHNEWTRMDRDLSSVQHIEPAETVWASCPTMWHLGISSAFGPMFTCITYACREEVIRTRVHVNYISTQKNPVIRTRAQRPRSGTKPITLKWSRLKLK